MWFDVLIINDLMILICYIELNVSIKLIMFICFMWGKYVDLKF